jgi:hypothetical protein
MLLIGSYAGPDKHRILLEQDIGAPLDEKIGGRQTGCARADACHGNRRPSHELPRNEQRYGPTVCSCIGPRASPWSGHTWILARKLIHKFSAQLGNRRHYLKESDHDQRH